MRDHLLLRFEAPLQAWGDVALDTARPTRWFPSRSALAGLLASALGWTYRHGDRTTALQDALHYAVREDRPPQRIIDFQTADLDRERSGWTRWGIETRGGRGAIGTQILHKHYLADGSLLVALTLRPDAPVELDAIADALRHPARPLFLGRKSCPPATSLLEGRLEAESPYAALTSAPAPRGATPPLRCWYEPDDGPDDGVVSTVWDRRDFTTDRFVGSRRIVEGQVQPPVDDGGAP